MSPYPSTSEPDYAHTTDEELRLAKGGLTDSPVSILKLLDDPETRDPALWGPDHLNAVQAVYIDDLPSERIVSQASPLDIPAIRLAFAGNGDAPNAWQRSWRHNLQSLLRSRPGDDLRSRAFMALMCAYNLAMRLVWVRFRFRMVNNLKKANKKNELPLGRGLVAWQDGRLQWVSCVVGSYDRRALNGTWAPPVANLIDTSINDIQRNVRQAEMHLALAKHAEEEHWGIPDPSVRDPGECGRWVQNWKVEQRLQQEEEEHTKLYFETYVLHTICDGIQTPRISFSAACIAQSYLKALWTGGLSISDGDYDSYLKIRRTRYYDLSNQKDVKDVGEILCRITAVVGDHP